MNCFRYDHGIVDKSSKEESPLEIHSKTLILIDDMISLFLYIFKTFHNKNIMRTEMTSRQINIQSQLKIWL